MKKLLFLLVLLGAALAAVAYWLSHPASPVEGNGFTLLRVGHGAMVESVSATGGIKPKEVIAVGSELSGKVVDISANADFNKTVTEGEALLQLDDIMARQAVEEAEAAVAAAEADLARAQAGHDAAQLKVTRLTDLVRRDIGMQRELDEARMLLKAADAGIKAAEAIIERAKAARSKAKRGLELTTVRVPDRTDRKDQPAGPKKQYTIIERNVVRGQLIGPPASAQLFTLASDLGKMQVFAQVAEGDITKIRLGLDATFTIYGYSEEEKRFQGKVVEIRPMPTNVHGAVFYSTVIDVDNERDPQTKEWRLRPGMTAQVDINLRRHDSVWKVPTRALSFQLDKEYQTEAAKAKLRKWQERKDADDWNVVWVLDGEKKPWPVFVRIGGKNAAGEMGLKDGQYNEVLEWDPELKPAPDPSKPVTHPEVIVDAPPAQKQSIFNRQIKLF